jgi:sterol desaturase/sphingolipid hydroxylase (fatty acid hydroxylase superfamily)
MPQVVDILGNAALTILVLVLLFVPLERAFPAQPAQRSVRPQSALDLAFLLGQQLCFGYLIMAALQWMHTHAALLPLRELRVTFGAQPMWLRVLEAVMLGDLLAYWGHRLQHRLPPLWRFHAVHHSSEHLDWLAAHREHPLDGLYTQTLLNLPMILTGFTLEAATGVVVFRSAWAVFIHSNVRIPLGPLAWLFGAPQLHHWHHEPSADTCNYGNLAPWTDLLFGTHRFRAREPSQLGLQPPMAASYWRMLLDPFKPTANERATPGSDSRFESA